MSGKKSSATSDPFVDVFKLPQGYFVMRARISTVANYYTLYPPTVREILESLTQGRPYDTLKHDIRVASVAINTLLPVIPQAPMAARYMR